LTTESFDGGIGNRIRIFLDRCTTCQASQRNHKNEKKDEKLDWFHTPNVKDPVDKAIREGILNNELPFIQLLLEAYASGIFPMGTPEGHIEWYSPDPRGILPLDEFHTPHGLRRALKKTDWEIKIDHDFRGVLKACAFREKTWITPDIEQCYLQLFEEGYAHSVEVWLDGFLAGGLYGVSLGAAFFGESMFHRVTDASKVALWHLVKILRQNGYLLLDTQWNTPHLATFGAREISRSDYLGQLAGALEIKASFPRAKDA